MTYVAGNFSDLSNTELGRNLWDFLNESCSKEKMVVATRLHRPAVQGVDFELLGHFGQDVRQDRVKQMTGHMVRQIMEDQGYVLDRQNVKCPRSPLFTSASRYTSRGL